MGICWDKRYIGDQTVDVVINAVAAARLNKKAEILSSLQISEMKRYGMSDGVRDAVEYDSLLTLQVGVSALQQGTAEKLNLASDAVDTIHKKISQ
ncbi:MAG: hypothetical protein M3N91_04165 [Pseudomonadota bacterium]|nr:hypothetical protein [Pseudomonadota bacterium]